MTYPRDPRLYVDDMCAALDELSRILADGEAEFFAHTRTRLAAERLIEILGEASAQIPGDVRNRFPEVPWRDLTDMRNRLIHGYHTVDAQRVWAVILSGVPGLRTQLTTVRNALDQSS